MFSVYWDDKIASGINNVSELDAQLDFISSASVPTVAVIEDENGGDAMSIGLGLKLSVLAFLPSTPSRPNLISKGSSESNDRVEFKFMGEPSEYSGRNLVPIELAREAAREFFRTTSEPSGLEWEAS